MPSKTRRIGSLWMSAILAMGCQSNRPSVQEKLSNFEQEILRDLGSKDEWKRTNAASRAAFFKIGAAAPLLVKMLSHTHVYSLGLDAMGHPVTSSEASEAESALLTLGPESVEPLIFATSDSRARVRQSAVELLTSIGDSRADNVLVAALHDRDANVRLAAMSWKSEDKEYMVTSRIKLLLRDSDERVRAEAVNQLTEFGSDPRVVSAFRVASKDKSEEVKEAISFINKRTP